MRKATQDTAAAGKACLPSLPCSLRLGTLFLAVALAMGPAAVLAADGTQQPDVAAGAASADPWQGIDPGIFAERLRVHTENRGDLRIPPIAAFDRRKAIPNDRRPAAKTEPATQLAPRPATKRGSIARVDLPGGEKICALSFDLGETATATAGFDADIVTWLQDNDIPATLFLGGKWMRTHERRVRQLLRDPLFEIGNLGWTSEGFAAMPADRVRGQVLSTQAQYESIRDQSLREAGRVGQGSEADIPAVPLLFRFPHDRGSAAALEAVAACGLSAIGGNVTAEGVGTVSLLRGRAVAEKVVPGSILRFSADLVTPGSFQLLRYVVRELDRKGYRFATVGELLARGTAVVE